MGFPQPSTDYARVVESNDGTGTSVVTIDTEYEGARGYGYQKLTTGGTAKHLSTGLGTFIAGLVTAQGGGTGTLEATQQGGQSLGAVFASGTGDVKISNSGRGSLAHGRATGNAGAVAIEVSSSGAIASGYAGGYDAVSSKLRVTSTGAHAFGYSYAANGGTVDVSATGLGAMAMGYCTAFSAVTGYLRASGRGSFAGGGAYAGGKIKASGRCAFAFGYTNGPDIFATAQNAVQFGQGTNALAESVSVGTGPRFKGTTGAPAAPRNGDQWVANNYVYIRSNGVSVKIV